MKRGLADIPRLYGILHRCSGPSWWFLLGEWACSSDSADFVKGGITFFHVRIISIRGHSSNFARLAHMKEFMDCILYILVLFFGKVEIYCLPTEKTIVRISVALLANLGN
jgi:hypothetical protein